MCAFIHLPLSEPGRNHGYRQLALDRNAVGHFVVRGTLGGVPVTLLIDTGAASTVVDAEFCKAHGIALQETGRRGGGAGGITMEIFSLGEVGLTIGDRPLRTDGVFAIDLSHVNQGLSLKGAEPVQVVLGIDALRHHGAIIDCSTGSLFLDEG